VTELHQLLEYFAMLSSASLFNDIKPLKEHDIEKQKTEQKC